MGLRKPSKQRAEVGSVAMRMLWIPAVTTILAVGYCVLRTPWDHDAAATTLVTARTATPDMRGAPPRDIVRQLPEAALVPPDEAVAAHQLLDPVGAGHDVAR